MVQKSVLFRADAEPSIGTGDLTSLINLSQYFAADNWNCYFLIKDYPAALRLIKDYKLKNVSIINQNLCLSDEIDYINKMVAAYQLSLIFFEITARKLSDYTGITAKTKKACVSFDGEILPDMDVVINWDVDAHKLFDPVSNPKIKFLLGPTYVILPLNYDNDRILQRTFNLPPRKLLICMGGADERNYTQKLVDVLVESGAKIKTRIILGAGYQYGKTLEKNLEESSLTYKIKQNVSNMFEEYMRCDVAIAAGGLTASELVATRTPSILIATYRHQVHRCRYFDAHGWVRYLGYRKVNLPELLDALQRPVIPGKNAVFQPGAILEACNEIFQ
jgi:spore coat polysaccharide biosynthesis predicted glycosyltransferase SpsG